MESDIHLRLIKSLESSDSNTIYCSLVQIRTKVIINKEGVVSFRKLGGINSLLSLLSKPNEKINNIALSILGNCCTDPDTRELVVKSGGLEILTKILQCLEGTGIKNRCFRTIANMAQDQDSCQYFHDKNIPIILLKEFETCKEDDSRLILARAFRLLADNDDHMAFMIKSGVIKHLISQIDCSSGEMLKAYLKSFVHFTSGNHSNYEKQILEYLDKLQSLIKLTNSDSKCTRELALCALINLTKQSTLRPHLGNIGLIPIIIKEINHPSVKHPSQVTLINALGLLSRESVNRVKIRENEGLKLFIKFLSDESFKFLHCHIIKVLMNYKYDKTSLLALTHHGLIKVLVDQLAFYVDDNIEVHAPSDSKQLNSNNSKINKTEEKRPCQTTKEEGSDKSASLHSASFRVNSPSYQAVQDEMMLLTSKLKGKGYDSNQHDANPISPELSVYSSYTKSGSSSPNYNTNHSPYSSGRSSPAEISSELNLDQFYYDSDISSCNSPTNLVSDMLSSFEYGETCLDSGRYSPVLPDLKRRKIGDKIEFHQSLSEGPEILSDSFLKSLATPVSKTCNKQKESLYPETKKTETEVQSSVVWIFALLCHFSQLSTPPPDMISSVTLNTLLKYISCTSNPLTKGVKILLRLCSNCFCLKSLLLTGFVLEIVKKLIICKHDLCDTCKNLNHLGQILLKELSRTAEDGYAIGEIESVFLHGTKNEKVHFVLGLSCIIRNTRVSSILYHKHKGLDLMFDLMNNSDDHIIDIVTAFYQLALNIGIKEINASIDLKEKKEECFYIEPSGDDVVTFSVEGNSVNIKASRKLVCKHSEVFNVMLTGKFSETHLSKVKLSETSPSILNYFIHHCCGCEDCITMQTVTNSGSDAIQLFNFSDTYMLDSIARKIFITLYDKHCSLEFISDIYEIACRHSMSSDVGLNMKEILIHHLLVGSMSLSERIDCFKSLLKHTGAKDEFLSHLRIIIDKYL